MPAPRPRVSSALKALDTALVALREVIVALAHEDEPDQPVRPEPDRLLTLDQAAQRLGCSRSTIKRLIASGEVASLRVGGRRKINERALHELAQRAGRDGER